MKKQTIDGDVLRKEFALRLSELLQISTNDAYIRTACAITENYEQYKITFDGVTQGVIPLQLYGRLDEVSETYIKPMMRTLAWETEMFCLPEGVIPI